MKAFYDKYATRLGEKAAYKMICQEVKKAVEAHDDGTDALKRLAVAHEMIEDLFEVKGYSDPADYIK